MGLATIEEMRLQIFGQNGQIVHDTGSVTGAALEWPLETSDGESVKGGLYAYTLSIKERGLEKTRELRGHLIVDRATDHSSSTDRVWITGSDSTGIGMDLIVARADDATVAGASTNIELTKSRTVDARGHTERDLNGREIVMDGKSSSSAGKSIAAAPAGTPGQIAKFTTATEVGNSVMAELNGNIGIGANPDRQLTVQSASTGAYINVKASNGAQEVLLGADANGGIISTMTNHDLQLRAGGNNTRMIIKADGRVGIGSNAPNAKLFVEASEAFGIFCPNTANESIGVFGQSTGQNGTGVLGRYDGPSSTTGWGVFGFSPNGFAGVFGAGGRNGVFGQTASANESGVYGLCEGNCWGVSGFSTNGFAGVYGSGSQNGVYGQISSASDAFSGVYGLNNGNGLGVTGSSVNGHGVLGDTANASRFGGYFRNRAGGGGLIGQTQSVNDAFSGVFGRNDGNGWGVVGSSLNGHGMLGETSSGSRFGGLFRNTGGGVSLRAEGIASVGSLQITGGADLSENFDVNVAQGTAKHATKPEPGFVVSIDPSKPGKLKMSTKSYDRLAVGVISGAGGVKPAMVMSHEGTIADGKYPVAVSGRVYVWVDASYGSIKPGDLLTTSRTPGHAMKASKRSHSQGAIIGKAMSGLQSGKGLVLILVTLQ